MGGGRAAVRSHHHQGIASLGEGLVATGWAEPGDAIEAIEAPDRRWVLGILWHAEEDPRSSVLADFTAAAARVAA